MTLWVAKNIHSMYRPSKTDVNPIISGCAHYAAIPWNVKINMTQINANSGGIQLL